MNCNNSRSLDIVIKPDCTLCSVTTGAVFDERAPNGKHCADSRNKEPYAIKA
jgi:hypothetical protein